MKPGLSIVVAMALFAGGQSLASATPRGGGGGGGSSCDIICRFIYGSCQVPSGDPDIPPLHDPFCERSLAACVATCSGNLGGGIHIGAAQRDERLNRQCSAVIESACASPHEPNHRTAVDG